MATTLLVNLLPSPASPLYLIYAIARPLRIITGRGTHSVNGVGVLAPAVKSALLGDGWAVGSFEGGLVVRGKSAWRTL